MRIRASLTIFSSAKCSSVRQSRKLFSACLGSSPLRMPRERADVGRYCAATTSSLCLAGGGFANGDLDADGGFATHHVRDLIRLRLAGTVIREIAGRVRGGPAVASKFTNSMRFSPKRSPLGSIRKL
jgi:hypothetical protein